MVHVMEHDANILVVDDDEVIRNLLTRYLSSVGYVVKTARNGEEMHEVIKRNSPDLIILDLQMPGKHGFELAREIRKDSETGIIILTGSEQPVDKIVGLEIGADDYVPKPFDERELLARVRSVLRRVKKSVNQTGNHDSSLARFDDWTLDFIAHELKDSGGKEVNLTSFEFQLLATLVKSPNRVLSRDQIMEHITGRDWVPSDRSVDVLVGKLRKKIEANSHKPDIIKTIRGTGYKFTARVKFS